MKNIPAKIEITDCFLREKEISDIGHVVDDPQWEGMYHIYGAIDGKEFYFKLPTKKWEYFQKTKGEQK